MGHVRGDYMNVIHVSEDEDGNSSSKFITSPWAPSEKNYPSTIGEAIALQEFVSDDTDQQFWAEDELSCSDSRSIMSKRKRRHSVAHRNRKYRSKLRLNCTSSSSSYLLNARFPTVRRRRKQRDCHKQYPMSISKPSYNGTRRNILKKNRDTIIRSLRRKKK